MARFSILDVLLFEGIAIDLVDVGARPTGDERYLGLLERGALRLVGFEPDPEQLAILREKFPEHRFSGECVGDGRRRTFHQCRFGGCSSLYRPDADVINHFTGISAHEGAQFEVIATREVQTRRLDDLDEVTACDYLKLDVQGAELDVLKGATDLLGNCLMAEVEVEFVPIYEGQPLFAEVDAFMRAHGFFLHRLVDLAGRAFRPFVVDDNYHKPVSQLLWADAVFVRRFTDFAEMEPEALIKLAVMAHEFLGSVDLAARALAYVDGKSGTAFQTLYLKELSTRGFEISFVNVKDWTD